MKVVLVASTEAEIKPTIDYFEQNRQALFSGEQSDFNSIITGVGLVATAYSLGAFLAEHSPDLLIHAGIAGSIDPSLELAEVVRIKQDELYGFGAEDRTHFISANELGFARAEEGYAFQDSLSLKLETLNSLKKVNAITVQQVHGAVNSIERLHDLNPKAQIETMEAAAAWFACNKRGVPYLGIRSISNYVEPRNRGAWQVEEAIHSLNALLVKLLGELFP